MVSVFWLWSSQLLSNAPNKYAQFEVNSLSVAFSYQNFPLNYLHLEHNSFLLFILFVNKGFWDVSFRFTLFADFLIGP